MASIDDVVRAGRAHPQVTDTLRDAEEEIRRMDRIVEANRAMNDSLERMMRAGVVETPPWERFEPTSARSLHDLAARQAAHQARVVGAQAERDDLQRRQVELLRVLVDEVVLMKTDAATNSKRSQARFWAIVGLTALGITVAIAGLLQ